MILKVVIVRVTGSNPVCASIINKLTYKHMAKKFKRENCDSTLRATVTDQLGRTVSLFGTHAFEWSIVIASDNSITMQTFKKGDIARKEFNKYKRKR
jgi:hypothetical protein